MNGFKLIKTTYEENKEIIGVHFKDGEHYNLFVKQVKKAYNLPMDSEIQVFTNDFIVRPEIFADLVAQYINNLEFVLDIKLSDAVNCVSSFTISEPDIKFSQDHAWINQQRLPSTEDIKLIREFQEVSTVRALENKHRTKIAKALISFVLNNVPDKKLVRDDFIQLAQSIVEIFPSEVKETYYVPFKKGHLAKGKLFDSYNNIRARLRATGVLRRRTEMELEKDHTADADNSVASSLAVSEPVVQFTSANTWFTQKSCLQKVDLGLPTTQDIKQIPEFQEVLKVRAMQNKYRTKIAKALISFVLNNEPNRKLIREDFLQLAQSIVDIFPSELRETYYVPFKKGRLAKGKLFDSYNNIKARLRAAGVIRKRIKSELEEGGTAENSNDWANESAKVDLDECELEILKSGCAKWNLVLAAWKRSHSFRQNELQNENFTTTDYIEKYQVLLNEKNSELFDIDFKSLYPKTKNIYEWKLYYRKIISKAEKIRDKHVKEIITYIRNTNEEDSKLALALMLLPYILPSYRKRPKLLIQESFICYRKHDLFADDESGHRVKRLKIESQPKIYLIGDHGKTVCCAYVDMCGIRLKFENPMKAIEVCFQCFVGMNIKYPKYCSHVWIFIQKLIFEITTPWDTVIPSINTLINDLHSDIQRMGK